MGWAIGYLNGRDVGYGVPALCDQPGCKKKIDRGLGYICGQDIGGGEHGCGLFFCEDHKHWYDNPTDEDDCSPLLCERCGYNFELGEDADYNHKDYKQPFDPKPDIPRWLKWKLKHPSWQQWREENPEEVATIKQQLGDK